jgi:hypothetical protein
MDPDWANHPALASWYDNLNASVQNLVAPEPALHAAARDQRAAVEKAVNRLIDGLIAIRKLDETEGCRFRPSGGWDITASPQSADEDGKEAKP